MKPRWLATVLDVVFILACAAFLVLAVLVSIVMVGWWQP